MGRVGRSSRASERTVESDDLRPISQICTLAVDAKLNGPVELDANVGRVGERQPVNLLMVGDVERALPWCRPETYSAGRAVQKAERLRHKKRRGKSGEAKGGGQRGMRFPAEVMAERAYFFFRSCWSKST